MGTCLEAERTRYDAVKGVMVSYFQAGDPVRWESRPGVMAFGYVEDPTFEGNCSVARVSVSGAIGVSSPGRVSELVVVNWSELSHALHYARRPVASPTGVTVHERTYEHE